jgi:hypothetical protein
MDNRYRYTWREKAPNVSVFIVDTVSRAWVCIQMRAAMFCGKAIGGANRCVHTASGIASCQLLVPVHSQAAALRNLERPAAMHIHEHFKRVPRAGCRASANA